MTRRSLGVQAPAAGLEVGIIESTTWEEAGSEWRAWIRQRTRWIKGYMVTALVHTRRPLRLWRSVGTRGAVGVVGLIAGTGAVIVFSALAARRRKAYDLMPVALLNPAYWVLHSIAAWRALYQLIRNPSHWEKTPHGIVHGPHAPRVAEPTAATVTALPPAGRGRG